MRLLHAPVHAGVITALKDIFEGGYPADKVIQRQLKFNRKWGSSDRRLFAESVYDIVRWWRRLLFAAGFEWPAEDVWSGGPAEAYVSAVEAWAEINDVEIGKGAARVKLPRVTAIWNDKNLPRAVRESVPDWLDAWGFEELGPKWEEVLPALNTEAPVYLRANRLKVTPDELVKQLRHEKIESEAVSGDAVRLNKRANVFVTKTFKSGAFEVQDLSSQQAALALDPQGGERVIDACAGGGGKSLHMASLMRNKGRIVAMDVHERKLEQLRERARRAGATCIETRLIDSTKVIKRQAGAADRLLLDVPCSGMGVLRRNPDSKWKLSRQEVERVRALQSEILSSYVQMLKPGGRLVYATCSIMPSENSRQVEQFLSRNETGFELNMQTVYWPQKGLGDGFYTATLTKTS